MDTQHLRAGAALVERQKTVAVLGRVDHSCRSLPHERQLFGQLLRLLRQALQVPLFWTKCPQQSNLGHADANQHGQD